MEETNMFSNKEKPSLVDIYFDLFLELQDEIGEEIVLKGNILLNKILPDRARSTIDLDASIVDKRLYYECAVPILEEFGEDCIEKGLADEYKIREIKERRSGGIDLKLGGSKALSVDINLQDIYSPYSFKKYLFDLNEVYGASVNKIVADKCLSTLSRKRFRRAKDFYDLWIIWKSSLDVNLDKVLELMEEKVGRSEFIKLATNYPFSETIIKELLKAWSKLVLTRDSDDKEIVKPDLVDILNHISEYYEVFKRKAEDYVSS